VLQKLRFGLIGLFLLGGFAAHADTVSVSGVFAQDDQVQLFFYQVPTTGFVTVSTTSYAGGGFLPVLSLFDFNTHEFLFADTGYSLNQDASLMWNSVGGEWYIVALTQYGNDANGPTLEDGFKEQGNGNYTAFPPYNPDMPGSSFLNPGPEQRTPDWTVQFDSAAPGLVVAPEPSTFVLFGSAAAVLIFRRRRQTGVRS
jgi:hypothetical protein